MRIGLLIWTFKFFINWYLLIHIRGDTYRTVILVMNLIWVWWHFTQWFSSFIPVFPSITEGFLVSTTMDTNRENKMSREHILHFDYDGMLCGILPFLGPGPRSFYPVYLPGKPELSATSSDHGKSGWHVFFRDGHGGICCLRAGLHWNG